MSELSWKHEAQKQAADAGTLKMNLALRLDDINTRIRNMEQQIMVSDDKDASIDLLNRISALKEERVWLVTVLYGKGWISNA